jgi:mono/diheme cytochrome c family protein
MLSLLMIWLAWWWFHLPRTPQQFFQVRCSACHVLPLADLCKRSREERAGIVHAMRSLHGADEVIDDDEARIISTYIEESFTCL